MAGGAWNAVANIAGGGGQAFCNPELLTDGTVIVHDCNTPDWWKLTPDNTGNYINGTWRKIASLPVIKGTQYKPQYNASAVLPDGRLIIMGGEYNGSNTEVWSSLGAIYDPIADSWTPVPAPAGAGWINTESGGNCNGGIGDAASVVIPNGAFLLSAACAFPSVDALFNAKTASWTNTGTPAQYQNEQGYTLLPNNKVMTIDVWNPPAVQQYDPVKGSWASSASTPISLVDPPACRNFEIGPAITRPDGTIVAFGGNTGCMAPAADPTAIFTPSSNSWITGPNVPTSGGQPFTLADAPAAMLPNGNILFAASPGFGNSPTHFFEFSSANVITQVADDLYFSSSSAAYYYNFLSLPSGQILSTDFSAYVEIYTPTGSAAASLAPAVTSAPGCLSPGRTYTLQGTQLNGLSQGAAYGDDEQSSTNYPIVRIVNNNSGHVFYARTFGHSTMSIALRQAGSTNLTVAADTESGASTLYVVANGIPSAGVAVMVPCSGGLALTPSGDIAASGRKGGPFTPSSFSYTLTDESENVNYAIANAPSWLTASPASGKVGASPATITFTVNKSANSLAPGSYINNININNTTDGQGNTTRVARLSIVGVTTTKLVASANPAAEGQTVVFTATVTDAGGGPSATGAVTFNDGSAALGTAPLSDGKATFSTSSLAVGVHSITAAYGGDVNNAASVSAALQQKVKAAKTTVAVASNMNPSTKGQAVTFTATLGGGDDATGAVIFRNGSAVIGAPPLSGGSAIFTTSALTVGVHRITARYGGDENNAASVSAALKQKVSKVETSVALAGSVNPSTKGETVTFTATLTASDGATGKVIFKSGSFTLGSRMLSGDKAVFETSALSAGVHSITARYSGDANDAASTSAALMQTVNRPPSNGAVALRRMNPAAAAAP